MHVGWHQCVLALRLNYQNVLLCLFFFFLNTHKTLSGKLKMHFYMRVCARTFLGLIIITWLAADQIEEKKVIYILFFMWD